MQGLASAVPFYGTTYLRHASGAYLAMEDQRLRLSRERFPLRLECFEGDRFYIVHRERREVAEYYGGTLNTAPDSGYTVQHWRLFATRDGALLIEHADRGMYLGMGEDGQLALLAAKTPTDAIRFYLEESAFTEGLPYVEVLSGDGHVALRVCPEVLSLTDRAWLASLADAVSEAASAMSYLTLFFPFPQIEVRAYTDCAEWGYVFREMPIIHVNRRAFLEDVEKMRRRDTRDVSFGLLHELSHLFDRERWMFDGEALANMKVAYALLRLGATAAPAEFPAEVTFNGNTLAEGLYSQDGRLADLRGRFFTSLSAKLMEIAGEVGWEAVRSAFIGFPNMNFSPRIERFSAFLDRIGEASGRDVRAMLSPEEWEVIRRNLCENT